MIISLLKARVQIKHNYQAHPCCDHAGTSRSLHSRISPSSLYSCHNLWIFFCKSRSKLVATGMELTIHWAPWKDKTGSHQQGLHLVFPNCISFWTFPITLCVLSGSSRMQLIWNISQTVVITRHLLVAWIGQPRCALLNCTCQWYYL